MARERLGTARERLGTARERLGTARDREEAILVPSAFEVTVARYASKYASR